MSQRPLRRALGAVDHVELKRGLVSVTWLVIHFTPVYFPYNALFGNRWLSVKVGVCGAEHHHLEGKVRRGSVPPQQVPRAASL